MDNKTFTGKLARRKSIHSLFFLLFNGRRKEIMERRTGDQIRIAATAKIETV